jgi:hypothetical protein
VNKGVADGEAVAKEAVLEVQLAVAATLVATITAVVWYILDAVQTVGFGTVLELFAAMFGVTVLQLVVIDYTWFLLQRGAWLATALLARQDVRNHDDPAFWARLERLYDAGSVRFYLGLTHLMTGTLCLFLYWCVASLKGNMGFAGWLGAAVALLLFADPFLNRKVPQWRKKISPRMDLVKSKLGLHWVEPPYRDAATRGCLARIGRLVLLLTLLVADLAWVVVAALEPQQEVVHRSEDVVLRFKLGGVRPSAESVSLKLYSETLSTELLLSHTHWMGDGMLIVIPASEVPLGLHTVAIEELKIETGGDNQSLTINRPEPAVFLVVH